MEEAAAVKQKMQEEAAKKNREELAAELAAAEHKFSQFDAFLKWYRTVRKAAAQALTVGEDGTGRRAKQKSR